MDQLFKNPPATQETWVPSLGWEDPLEKATAPHSSILAWRVHGVAKSQTQLSNFHFISLHHVVSKNEEKALRGVKCDDGATIKIPVSVGERSAQ